MPSNPDAEGGPENGVPAPTETQRAELADALAEIRSAPVPESVRLIPSKPCSRQTNRLLDYALADFRRVTAVIEQDAAKDEGIDLSCFRLDAFNGQPAHWKPVVASK